MKRYKYLISLLVIPLWVACFEDKGNYNYRDMGDITIENIPDVIEVLANADPVVINPKVFSTLEGEIKDGNPDYQFIYKFDLKSGYIVSSSEPWVILNPDGKMSIDTLLSFSANNYIGWFIVKDLRTGLETYKAFDVKITSPTYEGWLILCNEGDQNRVRFDMVSRISADKIIPVYDIMKGLGLPEGKNAFQLGFSPTRYGGQTDRIFLFGEDGGYILNAETFKTDASWNIKNINFVIPPADNVAYFTTLNYGSAYANDLWFCVTQSGNAYVKMDMSGAGFEYPINTSVRGGQTEFKVAPFVGVSMARPGNGECALMYDIDNRRFVGWAYSENMDAAQTMAPLQDPASGKLFSYQTGKELIYMESTRFSGGIVYSVLQDNSGKRCIYGVNTGGSEFRQELAYEQINAPDFNQAKKFAFHSQYPFMFYAVKNKVYLYDFGTGTNYPLTDIKLGDTEEVTLLKFNLYQNPELSVLADASDEFLARQYDLIVGTYDQAAGNNSGKLKFYRVNSATHTVAKRDEYSGFAKIVDVMYRERRK